VTRRLAAAAALCLLLPAAEAWCEGFKVLATFLPMYIFAANVARDVPGVTVELLLPAALGCPHDYALSPGDMKRIAGADLLVANGMGQEEFLGRPVQAANPRIRVVESAAGILPLPSGPGPRAAPNPHTWVSPRNAARQVEAIGEALAAAYPAGADRFRRNAGAYAARLSALASGMEAAARRFRSRRIVTFHNAFDYLARDLGLEVVARIEDTPGQEPSAGQIARLVRLIRERRAAAVFAEPQYPERLAAAVAREAGVPLRVLDPVVTGPADPAAYERAMRANLAVLADALGRP